MSSRRENILAAVRTALTGTSGVGTRIYRSRQEAFSRSESPALVIEPVNDQAIIETSLPTLTWALTVRIAVVVRGLVPDQLADPSIVSAHSRLMADLTLGGYAMDIAPQGVNFDMADADQSAGVIMCDYLIRYRTTLSSLES
jgi:hypothetical protein